MIRGHDSATELMAERERKLATAAAYFGNAPGSDRNLAGFAAYLDEEIREQREKAEVIARVAHLEWRLAEVEGRLSVHAADLDGLYGISAPEPD